MKTAAENRPDPGTPEHSALVALQNDQFRRWYCAGERKPGIFIPGRSVWTAAIEARDAAVKRAAIQDIGTFDTFTPENDPVGWHDFGTVETMGETVWFNVDLYDATCEYGADDPIRGGRALLREAHYLPAFVAIRFNPDLKRGYDRLTANGKPAKVAITALMRKLIILANALIRDRPKMNTRSPLTRNGYFKG